MVVVEVSCAKEVLNATAPAVLAANSFTNVVFFIFVFAVVKRKFSVVLFATCPIRSLFNAHHESDGTLYLRVSISCLRRTNGELTRKFSQGLAFFFAKRWKD